MPPRFPPIKLSDWPWVVVRVDCPWCRRAGCYRLARLAARYGAEQDIAGLLRDLTSDCPWYDERARVPERRCAARFPDLLRGLPEDHPDRPVHRQRMPDREDLPRRHESFPVDHAGATPTLSGWAGEAISTWCRRCPARRTFAKRALLAQYGDVTLTVLLRRITSDCPRSGETRIYELCGASFVPP